MWLDRYGYIVVVSEIDGYDFYSPVLDEDMYKMECYFEKDINKIVEAMENTITELKDC